MDSVLPQCILILGCTASGKSSTALRLAQELDAEIVSVDSMQVYRRMDIGTAKPDALELAAVSHHMVNIAEPWESFSVAKFVTLADSAISQITSRGKRVLITAGTPLYLMGLMYGMFDGPSANDAFRDDVRKRAALEGTANLHMELTKIDPESAERIHPNDLKRIERALEVFHLTGRKLSEQQTQWSSGALRYPCCVVGIRREKEDLSRRINTRVHAMIDAGLVEEVRRLLADQHGLGEQARQALGYAEIIAYLSKKFSLTEAVEKIKINTRQFAKHQRTWFRKFTMAHWLDVNSNEGTDETVERLNKLITALTPSDSA